MNTIEYRLWCPEASPLRVEFPAELIRGLGSGETSGVLYGSRRGREIRVVDIKAEKPEEEGEKVGVFVSRIRGEVFLTEMDLAFLHAQEAEVALVIAGERAGFFVREVNGSIQTVRSHEEFSIVREDAAAHEVAIKPRMPEPVRKRAAGKRQRTWAPAGLVMLAALPIAALALFPQRGAEEPRELQVREADGQLQISWKPGRNAVLVIEDSGRRLTTPVYADQSNVTYARRGAQVEVNLLTTDAANQPRSERALYVSSSVGPP